MDGIGIDVLLLLLIGSKGEINGVLGEVTLSLSLSFGGLSSTVFGFRFITDEAVLSFNTWHFKSSIVLQLLTLWFTIAILGFVT